MRPIKKGFEILLKNNIHTLYIPTIYGVAMTQILLWARNDDDLIKEMILKMKKI
jgi:hypothetical protein